jgi:membrane-bound metal-dependent hydrolase YbcI (DUF457 family)
MASWRGHITFSTGLGVAYAAASWWQLHVDWPVACVGGLLTALGGLLPDLDSDSGVPVRELSHLAAAIVPLVLLRRVAGMGISPEQALLIVAGSYLFVRYVLTNLFRKFTVHRGMFHSIPAMLIAGLLTFLGLDHPAFESRMFFSIGVMIGFLSHLVLDELCSVDLNGAVPHLNKMAGTAVKFWSPSLVSTSFTYILLAGLGYEAWRETQGMTPASALEQTSLAANQPGPPSPPRADLPKLGFSERPILRNPLLQPRKDKKTEGNMTLSVPSPGFNK